MDVCLNHDLPDFTDMKRNSRVDWGKEADWGKKTFSFKIEKLLKNKKILSPCGDKHCG